MIYTQELQKPFPQHTVYNKNIIKPKTQNQAEMDKVVQDFYNVWKKAYLRNNCADHTQYYILDNEDVEKGDQFKSVCVSEGQGYGMLITVLMAGYDKDAKVIYDGMYKFYKAHPSKSSNYLMSWSILKDCITNTKKENQSSASDGDFDIALSLLMASSQWGDKGEINYHDEALKMLDAILKFEINHKRNTILLGDDNKPTDYDYDDIRTSDFMPVHLRVFNKYLSDKSWLQVLNHTYKILQQIQDEYSPNTALIPDFIIYRNGKYMPAKANYLESPYDGAYYFNACRVPMRIAMDKILFGNGQADTILTQFNEWVQKKTNYSVDKITSGYYLNGQKIEKEINTIPSFVCTIAVSAMINRENQEWLDDLWDYTAKEFEFKDYKYYDNSIQMLSLLVLSGNYWLP